MRVDPGEIEDVLRSCDEVADAAVVRIGDDERPTLVAYIVLKNRNFGSVASKLLGRDLHSTAPIYAAGSASVH
jgi:acyl-coenzyme A synthetase/AMP-(fatty) acid ligase